MHVALRNVSKTYGRFAALDDVTLELEPGQAVAIVGANGAGKTTLLHALAAVALPSAGEVRFDGEQLARDRLDLRRRQLMIPDDPELAAESIVAHVALLVRLFERSGEGLADRVVAWLRACDLLAAADVPWATLSRGERYKAALVGFLAVDPDLWLLDEPFASGMDPAGLALFRRELRAAVARGRTIVFTTQLLEIAERDADRVAVLADGRLRAFGTLDELRRQAGSADGAPLARVFERLHEASG